MSDEFRTYDIDTLSDYVDYFIGALHDESGDTDSPGAIAGMDWCEGWLNTISSFGNRDQWIISLGAYGYDWTQGAKTADTIDFPDAMSRAAYATNTKADIDGPDYNPNYAYTLAGVEHTVWFLDAITFLNQARLAHRKGFVNIAIERLGLEDPGVWLALDIANSPNELQPADLHPLEELKPGRSITNIGSGEIVTVDLSSTPGSRTVAIEPGGRISEVYTTFPEYPSLYHQGSGGEHEVAITFDDGPDPVWTPKVLKILKKEDVKAAFFLIGSQVEANPSLAKRILAEGHEIGNHTYYHTNLAESHDWQTRTELNATQRVIEDVTGRSTTFFRPPYEADSRPNDYAELVPLAIAQDLGYLTILENIDPEDWARPGADVIYQRVKQQRHNGSIVLLHDAGGDRSETVEALPRIIEYLKDRGDKIVPLGHLLGFDREDVNPVVVATEEPFVRWFSTACFQAIRWIVSFLWAFMILATVLIILRTALIVVLAILQRKKDAYLRANRSISSTPPDGVSVVIAAFNEGKVIVHTLRSVLATTYPGQLEILVVDDGSTDATSEKVQEIQNVDPRVRLIRQQNQGKASALTNGVSEASNEILVFLDADTVFEPETLSELVAPFADAQVGAVSGHARVGNLRTFIARCQSLEYICGFNLSVARTLIGTA